MSEDRCEACGRPEKYGRLIAEEWGRGQAIDAMVRVLRDKTDPRLIDAIIEDVREELRR
jgi:hypothetical protein